ncbi:MAG: hypothetical protein IT335_03490 [Thermomicrobiales bacterium]|nr:hypothetical protein [Thermomicrobiales bacterium]
MRHLLQSCPAPFASLGSLPLFDSDAGNFGEVAGQLAIDLQRHAGVDVRRFHCQCAATGESVRIVAEHEHPLVGRLSLETAVLLAERWPLEASGIQWLRETIFRLSSLIRSTTPDGTAAAIVRAARQRTVPVARVDPQGARIELGDGKWRRRIWGSQTNRTSAINEAISHHKPTANAYLRSAGLPVPQGTIVRSVDDAIDAARHIGYPIVLKPIDGGNSIGAFVGIESEAELKRHFEESAAATSSGLTLIEEFLPGRQFRIVVVDGRIVSVTEYTIAAVTGDGRSPIRQLIDAANQDPRRGPLDTDPMKPIDIDAMTVRILEKQSLSIDDIPDEGREIQLKQAARIANGGMSIDRTEEIHPDNTAIALQAVNLIDLDVAAIDVIAKDISESIRTTHGAIIDVNTSFHTYFQEYPAVGKGRDPGPAIIDMLFPPGTPVRVPIVAAIGHDAGEMCEEIARTLGQTGRCVGLATEARLAVGGMELKGVKRTGAEGIRTILNNPAVEIAVAEVTAQGIIDEGLGFGYCDAVVLLSTSGQSTPFGHPVESVLTQLVEPGGVIAFAPDDPVARDLGASTPARSLPIEPGGAGLWLDHVIELISTPD